MRQKLPGSSPAMAERQNDDLHHEPVLAGEVVELLITDTKGAYLDLTAGGGGHLRALAGCLDDQARLYGADIDPAAVQRTARALEGIAQFRNVIQTSFGDIHTAVDQLDETEFDGVLIDLGISSLQVDDPSRGISFRGDGPLDMRFDPSSGVTAGELLEKLSERELTEVIRKFGEERQAVRIARGIVRERQRGMILTTLQLRDIVLKVTKPPHQIKSLARVIAYHSLEDRPVKKFFSREAKGVCSCPPDLPVCVCGSKPSLRIVTRRPIVPGESEIARNPRARSARLRVAEKLL